MKRNILKMLFLITTFIVFGWSLGKKSENFSLDPDDAPQPTLNSVD